MGTSLSQEVIREQLERGYLKLHLHPSSVTSTPLYNPMRESLSGTMYMLLNKQVSDPLHLEIEISGQSCLKWKNKTTKQENGRGFKVTVRETEVWEEKYYEIIKETYSVQRFELASLLEPGEYSYQFKIKPISKFLPSTFTYES